MKMELDKIIELAGIIAKPYRVTSIILALLLVISLIGNIYLATQTYEITVDQDNVYSSESNNTNEVD
jgi:hypothetical protein